LDGLFCFVAIFYCRRLIRSRSAVAVRLSGVEASHGEGFSVYWAFLNTTTAVIARFNFAVQQSLADDSESIVSFDGNGVAY
jgi:hypothetical protein